MKRFFNCIRVFTYPSDSEDEDVESAPIKFECKISSVPKSVEVEVQTDPCPELDLKTAGKVESEVPEITNPDGKHLQTKLRPVKNSMSQNVEDVKIDVKEEQNKLFLAKIALAEESALRHKYEKMEKHRIEMAKFIGINAWKCDPITSMKKYKKFLFSYGESPECIQDGIIIVRKRNLKKERQRRLNECIARAELNWIADSKIRTNKNQDKIR